MSNALFLTIVRLIVSLLIGVMFITGCALIKPFRYMPRKKIRDTTRFVKYTFSALPKECNGKVVEHIRIKAIKSCLSNFPVTPDSFPRIAGKVMDKQHKPVMYCTVNIYDKGTMRLIKKTITDSTGHYDIHLMPNLYDIEYTIDNHEPVEIDTLTMQKNISHIIDVQVGDLDRYVYFEYWTKKKISLDEVHEAEPYVMKHKRYRVEAPKE